jgi:ankyrin repeat protein
VVQNLLDKGTTIQLDWKNLRGETPLGLAIGSGLSDLTERLVRIGVSDINTVCDNDRTPLTMAVLCHRTEMVKLLLSLGADPTIADAEGCTAYYWAYKHKVIESILLLKAARK